MHDSDNQSTLHKTHENLHSYVVVYNYAGHFCDDVLWRNLWNEARRATVTNIGNKSRAILFWPMKSFDLKSDFWSIINTVLGKKLFLDVVIIVSKFQYSILHPNIFLGWISMIDISKSTSQSVTSTSHKLKNLGSSITSCFLRFIKSNSVRSQHILSINVFFTENIVS